MVADESRESVPVEAVNSDSICMDLRACVCACAHEVRSEGWIQDILESVVRFPVCGCVRVRFSVREHTMHVRVLVHVLFVRTHTCERACASACAHVTVKPRVRSWSSAKK